MDAVQGLQPWLEERVAFQASRSSYETHSERLHNHPSENELRHAVEATPDRVSVHSLHRIQRITIDLRTVLGQIASRLPSLTRSCEASPFMSLLDSLLVFLVTVIGRSDDRFESTHFSIDFRTVRIADHRLELCHGVAIRVDAAYSRDASRKWTKRFTWD